MTNVSLFPVGLQICTITLDHSLDYQIQLNVYISYDSKNSMAQVPGGFHARQTDATQALVTRGNQRPRQGG